MQRLGFLLTFNKDLILSAPKSWSLGLDIYSTLQFGIIPITNFMLILCSSEHRIKFQVHKQGQHRISSNLAHQMNLVTVFKITIIIVNRN